MPQPMSTAPLPKRIEAFAVEGGLRGGLADLPLPELLAYLRQTKATGVLSVVAGGARKSVYVRDGRVVFATSNLPNDRLGEILLREGKISVEEYEASIKALSKGKRQGRVLVEMGALSPKDFWEGVQFQVREIVHSIFPWDEGQFHFESSTLPEQERITVDLDVRDLVLSGLRAVDAAGALSERFPEPSVVLERVAGESDAGLEAYERHVLGLVDGQRAVNDVCRESEIGDSETLKVLYALLSVGLLKPRGRKVHALDSDFVPEDSVVSVVQSFNNMYSYVFRYMVREVGPIAENVLEKYLGGLRESRREVFAGVKLQKDGTLDMGLLEKNLDRFPEEQRRSLLVDALNELLYAELLAVKRTLGSDHEANIIKAIREK